MKDRFTGKVKLGRGHIPKSVRKQVFQRDKYTCVFCKQSFAGSDLTIDHLVPLSKGGLNESTNFATCCKPCNQKKADIPLAQFLKEVGLSQRDMPVHLDPILDNDKLPVSMRKTRADVFNSLRSGKLKASGQSAQKKIEKSFRTRFWDTEDGKRLESEFPSLPGQARIMLPEIKALASTKREFALLLELSKSANTRNLISGFLQKASDIESSVRELAETSRDEALKKRVVQAIARFEKNTSRQRN